MPESYSANSRSHWQMAILLWIIVSVTVLGIIQPGYNHLRDTVSILAVGKYGWIQNLNFVLLTVFLWSLAKQYPFSNQKLLSVKRILFFTGLAVALLTVFPAQTADASIKHFQGWSNAKSFMHFFLVATTAMVLLPVFTIQLMKDTAGDPRWRKLRKQLLLCAPLSGIAIPIWLWLRISGFGYDYKGIIEKIAILCVIAITWQFQKHSTMKFPINKSGVTQDSAMISK